MSPRLPAALVALGCLFGAAGPAAADDAPPPDLKRLHEAVRTLVEKYYPKAKVTLADQAIAFEFNTRKYMIHEPLLSGEWQDAHEEVGPQKGGVVGSLELQAGPYGGQAAVPQAIDKRYFTLLLLAPYSKKLDQHLYVHLKYPRDASKEFVKEFEGLVNGFDRYVAGGK